MPPEPIGSGGLFILCVRMLLRVAGQRVRERTIADNRFRRGRHTRCTTILADRRCLRCVSGGRWNNLLVRTDQSDIAPHDRSRKGQPVRLLLILVSENDEFVCRTFRLVDPMKVYQNELASILGSFLHHLDPRTDRSVDERHIATVQVEVEYRTSVGNTPLQMFGQDSVTELHLWFEADTLRHLDVDDCTSV